MIPTPASAGCGRVRAWLLLTAIPFMVSGCMASMGSGMALPTRNVESSIEERIAQDFRRRGLKVSLNEVRDGDQTLVINWAGEGSQPPPKIVIDTQYSGVAPAGKSDAHRPRVILMMLYTGVVVPEHERSSVLRAINKHHATNWAGTFYVNPKDGEIEANWPLNIPANRARVHPDTIHDAMMRVLMSWQDLFRTIQGPTQRNL